MRRRNEVRTVLAPVDGSPTSTRALRIAAEISSAFGAELTVLHVDAMRELPVLIGEATDPKLDDEAQAILLESVKTCRALGVEPKIVRRRGRTADQILRAISQERPDLVVMGTRGLSRTRGLLMGSISQAVTRRAKTEVVLVR